MLRRRLSKTGAEAWGPKNKLAVHVESGIPVDLFATSAESWWNYLVCRTGPAASNIAIAQAALAGGGEAAAGRATSPLPRAWAPARRCPRRRGGRPW